MTRPKTRLDQLDEDTRLLFREVFGTCTHAFKCMSVGDRMTFSLFQEAWQGRRITSRDRSVIEEGFQGWLKRMAVLSGREAA